MVHYDPKHAAPTVPPICPKCGSHRTEIVGLSDNPPAIMLRCSACGAHSTVPLEDRESSEKIA